MLTRTLQFALATASANNIAQSQTPGGAGNLTLNGSAVSGGVATLDVARRVLITTTANETAKTFTITGTDRAGRTITETMTGPNNTTGFTLQDFKTITQIAVSAATTGALTVGTNGVGSSRWIGLNYLVQQFEVSIRVKVVSGSVTYTIEKTNDDLMGAYTPGNSGPVFVQAVLPAIVFPDPLLSQYTISGETNISSPCTAVRATIVAGTGTIDLAVLQAGVRG